MYALATAKGPSNIAVIKYWGKRDAKRNTPINSSVSVTLDIDQLHTVTTVFASPSTSGDRLWLNRSEEDIASNKRMSTVIHLMRERVARKDVVRLSDGSTAPGADVATWGIRVASFNSFPTAAGLASSASGYACLVSALATAFGVAIEEEDDLGADLSTVARQGSGSACRSLYGGFVRWDMGTRDDGADSRAVPIAPAEHWPELEALIFVVSDHAKDMPSTAGMQASVTTSPLLAHRASAIVPERLQRMEDAYRARDFATFADLTMKDSNQFHATCLDTQPPIFYMTDVSRAIVGMVHRLNEAAGETVAAYTFDAGPNAVVFALKKNLPVLLAAALRAFPPAPSADASAGPIDVLAGTWPFLRTSVPGVLAEAQEAAAAGAATAPFVDAAVRAPAPGAVRCLYHTRVGRGPVALGPDDSLLDPATGEPCS